MWELKCTDEKRKEKKGGKEKEKEDGAKGQKAKNNIERKKNFFTRFLCKRYLTLIR